VLLEILPRRDSKPEESEARRCILKRQKLVIETECGGRCAGGDGTVFRCSLGLLSCREVVVYSSRWFCQGV